MPRVPRYTQNQAQEQGIPSARYSTDVSREAFGGGQSLQNVQTQAAGLFDDAKDMILKERRKADEIAIQDADLQLGQLENEILSERSKMRGKNAAGAIDYLNQTWSKRTSEIEKNLVNDDQKLAFRARSKARYLGLDRSTNAYMESEFRDYDRTSTAAYKNNAIQQAADNYGDPDMTPRALMQIRQANLLYGQRNGLGDEVVNQLNQEDETKLHLGLVDRMIADGNIEAAEKYYLENRALLPSSVATKADGYIKRAKKDIEDQRKEAKEQAYDESFFNAMVKLKKKEIGIAEINALYEQGNLKYEDLKKLESEATTPDSKFSREEKDTAYQQAISMYYGLKRTDNEDGQMGYAKGNDSKKIQEFREWLGQNATKLDAADFQDLTKRTQEDYMNSLNGNTSWWKQIGGLLLKLNQYGISGLSANFARNLSNIKSGDQESLSKLYKETLKNASRLNNPSLMALDEPTNYTVSSGGGINVGYPEKSDAKTSQSADGEDYITVIRRSDNQRGQIPRSRFSNEKYLLA